MKHLKKFNENIIDYHAENVDRFIRELGRLGNTIEEPVRGQPMRFTNGMPPGIPLTRLEQIANDCDIEVVNYNQFFYDLPEDQRKTAPPRFNPAKREGMPVFALVNPKTKKQRLVVSVPVIDKQMIDMITHMLKHETVHVGQHAKRPAYDKPLPDPKNSKDYFGDTDEIMAYSQSIVDLLLKDGAKSVEEGIDKLQRVKGWDKNDHLGNLWNRIKESVDKDTLKKYMKYIYQYLELEFGTKPGKMGSKVAKKIVAKRPDPVNNAKKVNERPSKAALMARLSGKK